MTGTTTPQLDLSTAQIVGLVRNASDVLMAMWPLSSFIAANPARVLESEPFDRAVVKADQRLHGRGVLPPAAYRPFVKAGAISPDALRAAFDRRTKAISLAPVKLAGHAIPATSLQWSSLFENLFAEEGDSPDALADAAQAAARRLPETTAMAGGGTDRDDDAVDRQVDQLMVRWCAAYTDSGQAAWTMPRRDKGFWSAWRKLAPHEPIAKRARAVLTRRLREQRDGPERAILDSLNALGIAEAEWQRVLERHLLRLPGWASFLKWKAEHGVANGPDASLLSDYLAIRLIYTAALQAEPAPWPANTNRREPSAGASDGVRAARVAAVAAALHGAARTHGLPATMLWSLPSGEVEAVAAVLDRLPEAEQSLIWLEAHEETYRHGLLHGIASGLPADLKEKIKTESGTRPAAQAVFCIDVRSEPLRRNLESVGTFETLGFAGFFGVPIKYSAYGDVTSLDVCPALLKPRYRIAEVPSTACAGRGDTHRRGKDQVRQLKKVTSSLKGSAVSCFGFVESLGALFVAPFVGKTFAPVSYAGIGNWLERRLAAPIDVMPDLGPHKDEDETDRHDSGLPYGLSLDERLFFGEAALSIMGLTRNFARLVLLNGHGSLTENNPYGAALDCGACGGNAGGPSARLLAAVLNEPAVRDGLGKRGIVIPDDTLFLAGEHNTTTDRVTVFAEAEVPVSHRVDLDRLLQGLESARQQTCAERRSKLTLTGSADANAAEHALERATDWAQVRPEWGLARNAAFLIGPRWMTDHLNLDSRTFLHSYDWSIDANGKALEIILTAPMVVAEWINTQYYFSTVDNQRFGSGTKVTHNVVGLVGVMQGNAGDLQIGLPQQSVMSAEGQLYHEPLRLMTVCMAPLSRVSAIVNGNASLRQLFDNEWVTLVVIEPTSGQFLRYRPGGKWHEVAPLGAVAAAVPAQRVLAPILEPALS